jgi:histidinol dehydrogenase
MRWFRAAEPEFESNFSAFLDERRGAPQDVDAAVVEVIEAVRREGFEALRRYSARFDRTVIDEASVRVTPEEIAAGAAACEPDVREALAFAAGRIAPTMSASGPRTRAGRTRRGSISAGAGRRSTRSAFMCRAAVPPIRRRC